MFKAGDYHKRGHKKIVGHFTEIKPSTTPSIRGQSILDIIESNINVTLIDSGVTDPIQADDFGADGDHKVVFSLFWMPRVPQ